MVNCIRDLHLRIRSLKLSNTMGGFRVLFLFAVICIAYSSQHSYGLGECPDVTPVDNLEMRRMLGVWYVIRKTATTSSCLVYNFTATVEPNKYHLQQDSHLIIPGHFNYHYSGELTVPDPAVPANMRVKFSLNLASASYIVFMTDYYNYAAIFTCQDIAFGNRKSVSILSRKSTLDDSFLEKIQYKLTTFNLNPKELSIISQENCAKIKTGHNISITADTFSAKNAAGLVRKAGDKLGDGIESVAAGAKRIYNRYNGDDSDSDSNDTTKEKTRFTAANTNPDAEWLP